MVRSGLVKVLGIMMPSNDGGQGCEIDCVVVVVVVVGGSGGAEVGMENFMRELTWVRALL